MLSSISTRIGFDEVAESVKTWTPRKTADLTGVPPDAIEKAARWFARRERALPCTRAVWNISRKASKTCCA